MPAAVAAGAATAAEVASVGRLIAAAGLVEAFGHVSARTAGGGFAITSTAPLASATAAGVIACDDDGQPRGEIQPRGERSDLPLETPLHAAVYAARDDVGAICRTHSPAAVLAGVVPPVAHGLGGLSGRIETFDDPQLVTDGNRAAAAAAALGAGDCLLIRGNGALATAPDLPGAAVRAWFLEERARVSAAGARGLDAGELEERSRHYPVESERAWRWLASRFGEEGR